jgi:hypothetical protein
VTGRSRPARLAAGVLTLTALACADPPVSVFTSLQESECEAPAADVKAKFDASDLGVQHCGGVQGWQVLYVSSDANSWIELRSPSSSWSAEDAIIYERPIGLFPGVSSEMPLEWRVDPTRGPTALLLTVTAQDKDDTETRVSEVYVVRIAGERACLIGREASASSARTLADGPTACPAS